MSTAVVFGVKQAILRQWLKLLQTEQRLLDVYCNDCEAIRTFNKYKKCREVYSRLYQNGTRDILQLTVKA